MPQPTKPPDEARILACCDAYLSEFFSGFILTGFIPGLANPSRILRASTPELSIALQVVNASPIHMQAPPTPTNEPPVA